MKSNTDYPKVSLHIFELYTILLFRILVETVISGNRCCIRGYQNMINVVRLNNNLIRVLDSPSYLLLFLFRSLGKYEISSLTGEILSEALLMFNNCFL